MAARTVLCYVINSDVTVVDDMNANVKNVVCPYFERITFKCSKKREGGGIFSNTASALSDRITGTREVYCEFIDPEEGIAAKLGRLLGS